MKKDNILKIILSFIVGLLVSGVLLLSVMMYRDYQADKTTNNSQGTQQNTSVNYSKQNVEEKNAQVDFQKNGETKTTESEAKAEENNIDVTAENTKTEPQQVEDKTENTVVTSTVQQPKQIDNNINKSVNTTVTTQKQSTSSSVTTNSNVNKSTTKTTTNDTKPANTTTQTDNQNNNSSGYYIVNKNTKRFHLPTCGSIKKMNESNKIVFRGSRNEAISKGYQPCQNCKP